MIRKMTWFAAALTVASVTLSGASAAEVVIGGGWKASWDAALDPYVSVVSDGVFGNAVFVQKSAEFTQAPVAGVFPPIDITFTQIDPVAVSFIVINDESILNSTGVDWTDFHMELLNSPSALFDPAQTSTSGGPPPIGFSISPFTTAAFVNGNTRLDIAGGVVASGGSWFPGGGAFDGQLWIRPGVESSPPLSSFVLREQPTPEPASMALLSLGTLLALRRRR